ncbi:MAG: iron-sulfur cluster-binding protein [Actinomycetes bacterium]
MVGDGNPVVTGTRIDDPDASTWETATGNDSAGMLVPLPVSVREEQAPTWHHAVILDHRPIGDRYRFLRVHAPSIAVGTRAGQFVMITVARDNDGPVLPRPMAVYRTDLVGGTLDVVYGVQGQGTSRLASFTPGERLLVVGPLGRGFHLSPRTSHALIIGRGVGICSLSMLASDCAARGTGTHVVLSARSREALLGAQDFRSWGIRDLIESIDTEGTSDPAHLHRHLLGQLDEQPPEQIFTCGSERLTRVCTVLGQRWGAEVQVSVEAHMACGLGYCHGCASGAPGTASESPLVCTDGPVFRWEPDTRALAGTSPQVR